MLLTSSLCFMYSWTHRSGVNCYKNMADGTKVDCCTIVRMIEQWTIDIYIMDSFW